MEATYTKLRDGTWGVKAPTAAVGETVTVHKKNGEQRQERVTRVLWQGNGMCICAIKQHEAYNGPAFRGRARRQRVCERCGHTRDQCDDFDCMCDDCGGMTQ